MVGQFEVMRSGSVSAHVPYSARISPSDIPPARLGDDAGPPRNRCQKAEQLRVQSQHIVPEALGVRGLADFQTTITCTANGGQYVAWITIYLTYPIAATVVGVGVTGWHYYLCRTMTGEPFFQRQFGGEMADWWLTHPWMTGSISGGLVPAEAAATLDFSRLHGERKFLRAGFFIREKRRQLFPLAPLTSCSHPPALPKN